jgi:hypothetical protein
MLHLILGGAAVHRCDRRIIFIDGFSRRAETATRMILFCNLIAAPEFRLALGT